MGNERHAEAWKAEDTQVEMQGQRQRSACACCHEDGLVSDQSNTVINTDDNNQIIIQSIPHLLTVAYTIFNKPITKPHNLQDSIQTRRFLFHVPKASSSLKP